MLSVASCCDVLPVTRSTLHVQAQWFVVTRSLPILILCEVHFQPQSVPSILPHSKLRLNCMFYLSSTCNFDFDSCTLQPFFGIAGYSGQPRLSHGKKAHYFRNFTRHSKSRVISVSVTSSIVVIATFRDLGLG